MRARKLNSKAKQDLSLASRSGVEAAMLRISTNMPGRWFDSSNRYNSSIDYRLKQDITNGTVKSDDLADYIAASGPSHCLDGWSFLGKAISALTKGDPYNSVHFAYYSELRAVFSILATEGIGIFNNQHFVVLDSGETAPIRQEIPTHDVVWAAFKTWSKEDAAINLFNRVVSPDGIRLSDWLDAFNSGWVHLTNVGERWLQSWGIDIQVFRMDRAARNTASYQPTAMNPWQVLSVNDEIQVLDNLWQPLEPEFSSRFNNLDKYFLKILLEDQFRATTNKQAHSNSGQVRFKRNIGEMCTNLGFTGQKTDQWLEFLSKPSDPQLPLIAISQQKSQMGHSSQVVEVIARATLLLRIAAGSCSLLLNAAAINKDSLDFWIGPLGIDHGLWSTHDQPLEYTDLWEDIGTALEDLATDAGIPPPSTMEPAQFQNSQSALLGKLSQSERVGIWGLGL